MEELSRIKNIIELKLSPPPHKAIWKLVSGGSINQAYSISINSKKYFCKINDAASFPQMMEMEKNGLQLLETQKLIKVPQLLSVGESEGLQFILMEYIEQGNRTYTYWRKFGEQLAALHLVKNEKFGLQSNNYIGSLHQNNTQHKNWQAFFIECRLQPQIKLAVGKGLLTTVEAKALEKLFEKIPQIFPAEEASLLHGDLWSGNFLCDENENPVLIDPAVYYGSRHMDLAMTTLFGGFEKPFYESYHYHFPLSPNYETLWEVCNLYPLLVHLNLFGKSYLGQVLDVLKKFG